MKNIITIIVSTMICVALFTLWGFYSAVRPFRVVSDITPKYFNIPYEDVTFNTQDGIKINAWFIPSEKPHAKTIILLHGYPMDKGDILSTRLFLHKNYNLLFFDMRYFGKSTGHYTTLGKTEPLDLLAAIKYLHSRGINEVGVWGISLGAAVTLMTAPEAPEIKAIVSESSFASLDLMTYEYYHVPLLNYPLGQLTRLWGIIFLHYDAKEVSPLMAIKQLHIPILLIHVKNDDIISYKQALLLEDAQKNNPQFEAVILEQGKHGEPIKDYQAIIGKFFEKNLP